jgi:hypothetical protein
MMALVLERSTTLGQRYRLTMKSPYLRVIAEIGNFKVFEVDGSTIRKNTDKDFTNFGQHYRFKFIPEDEFWIDEGASPEERRFFIDHMLTENSLMAEGKSYKVALEAADAVESRERKRYTRAKTCKAKPSKEYKVEVKELKKIGDIEVWLVNGERVRNWYDIDFTEGGHDLVYTYIPSPNRVWIDNAMAEKEREPTIIHETTERALMAKGMSYDKAHQKALEAEWKWRHKHD